MPWATSASRRSARSARHSDEPSRFRSPDSSTNDGSSRWMIDEQVRDARVLQVPAAQRLDQVVGALHQLQLQPGVDPRVGEEALDLVPALVAVAHLAGHQERPHGVGRLGAGLGHDPPDPGDPERVDHVVRDHRGDDLAAQGVLAVQLAGRLDQLRREVLAQLALEERVVRDRSRPAPWPAASASRRPAARRQLGPGQRPAAALALGHLLGRRQVLDLRARAGPRARAPASRPRGPPSRACASACSWLRICTCR